MLKLIKHQRPDVNKIYSYVEDPFAWKYQLLINWKKVGISHEENPKAFICYSQIIDYIPKKKRKKKIVFDYIIVDMEAHKKLSPIVTELFKKDNKLNISLAFIWKSYFKVFEDIRLNVTHYFIMEKT